MRNLEVRSRLTDSAISANALAPFKLMERAVNADEEDVERG